MVFLKVPVALVLWGGGVVLFISIAYGHCHLAHNVLRNWTPQSVEESLQTGGHQLHEYPHFIL